MNKEEFQKYVIAEATKYLFSTENEVPAENLDLIKESVAISTTTTVVGDKLEPSEIKKLAEEIKKMNKKIDLRNPLISESDDSLVESILKENKSTLRERAVDVDDINKKKHVPFQNEGEKDTWNRMLSYNVPTDEDRP